MIEIREGPPSVAAYRRHGEEGETNGGEIISTERKVRLGFAFALICLGAIAVVSYLSVVRLNAHAASVEHTYRVLGGLEVLLAGVTDSETATRGYIITGDENYLEPYRQSAQVIDGQTKLLRELTADNLTQQQRLHSVELLVTSRLSDLRGVIELRKNQGFAAAQSAVLTGKGKQVHDRIRGLIDQMKGTEQSLLDDRERLAHRSSSITLAVIVGGGFLACALVALRSLQFDGILRAEREPTGHSTRPKTCSKRACRNAPRNCRLNSGD